jgi:hypothetical protein
MQEQLSLNDKLNRINKLILDIEDAKGLRERKIGEKDSVLATLRNQFGLDTLEAAKKRVLALDQQIIRRNEKIDKTFIELSKKYEI